MRTSRLVVVIGLVVALLLVGAPPVDAYGRDAIWQIGLSFNCNNPAACGSELGGFWGWVEFDQGNDGDAQVTGCEHMQGGRAGGAHHVAIDIHGWTIAAGSAGPAT